MTGTLDFPEALRSHDPLDIAAGSAALSLRPANAAHLSRLTALSLHALSTPADTAQPIRRADWLSWLLESPSLHQGPEWDPPDGLWTVPIAAPGGSFVLPTGGEAEDGSDLQLLIDALLLGPWSEDATDFRRQAARIVMGGLRILDHAAGRVGLARYRAPNSSPQPEIPPDAEFADAIGALDMNEADLERISEVRIADLQPLIHDLAVPLSPQRRLAGMSALSLTPIVAHDGRYVVADPLAFSVAIRHHVILASEASGWSETLASMVGAAVALRVKRAARFMDWEEQAVIEPDIGIPLKSLIYRIDTDKLCHVALICDDFEGYKRAEPRGFWDASGIASALQTRQHEVEWGYLMGPPPRPNNLLHLTVLGGIGRSAMVPVPQGIAPLEALQEILPIEALSTISMLGLDRLTLWKFAEEASKLREQTEVQPINPLDEFAAWWTNKQSFYLSDGPRPDVLLLSSHYGLSLREEAAEHDVHAARTSSGTYADVVRLYGDPVPVYAPIHDLGQQPRQLVEQASIPIWVTGPTEFATPEERKPSSTVVDCVAYWLWQMTPSLPDLSPIGEVVEIRARAENPAAWSTAKAAVGGPIATVGVSGVAIELTVGPAIVPRLNRGDNAAERDLIALVLEGLDGLLEARGGVPLGEAARAAAIERHAPVGAKKKIAVFGSEQSSPLLNPEGLPPYRAVGDSDMSTVLDLLGGKLREVRELSSGPIPSDQRVATLNWGAEALFQELQCLVATLSPLDLIESLVGMHEAMVQHGEMSRRMVGAQIACFGEDVPEQFREDIPNSARAGIAVRFLVEYVVASPPSGLRPFSIEVYDRLMALALEIVNLGMSSDIIHLGLEDSRLSILDSGRLGLDTDGTYAAGQRAFVEVSTPAKARAAAAAFADSWKAPGAQPPYMDELDAAARAEWGFTMTEIVELLKDLSRAAFERDPRAATEQREVLGDELAERLGWDSARVEAAIEFFALGPRADYMRPDAPFRPVDVYPWRFKRRLSYLRRPLLLRRGKDGEMVIWGGRHVEVAGRHLMNLIFGERLQASSDQMKQLMTKLRQQDARDFNDVVAQTFEDAGFPCRRRFEKAPGLRVSRPGGEPLGDIDVLVADVRHKVLLAVECKALEGARTPVELAAEIEGTFGVGSRKPSAVEKHLERAEWLDRHRAEALAVLGLSDCAESWSVTGRVIVDIDVMAPFVADCLLPVTPLHELHREFGMEGGQRPTP